MKTIYKIHQQTAAKRLRGKGDIQRVQKIQDRVITGLDLVSDYGLWCCEPILQMTTFARQGWNGLLKCNQSFVFFFFFFLLR